MSRAIFLSGIRGKGKFALVDDSDFEKVNQFKWCSDSKGYAIRSKKISGTRKSYAIYLHRAVLDLPRKKDNRLEVDHINGDKLDNQKKNLRVCTHQENRTNSKLQVNNTSGYKGVGYNNEEGRRKRWQVEFKFKGKKIHLGRYVTKEEAAKAYNEAAKKYYGEYARLNKI